jgi:hypothetical protein
VCYAPAEFGKSGGQAAKKLVMCGFSKRKHATECSENHEKNNYHVNSVSTSEKLMDERSGKFISVDKQEEKQKIAQAELNRKRLIPIFKTVIFAEDKEYHYVVIKIAEDFPHRMSRV